MRKWALLCSAFVLLFMLALQSCFIEEEAHRHFRQGNKHSKSGRFQEAIEAYKQAVRIRPDYAEAHLGLGSAYFYSGRYPEAIEAYEQALRIRPDYAEAHDGLGCVYISNGDNGSALEEYEILKTLDIETANRLFNLIDKPIQ